MTRLRWTGVLAAVFGSVAAEAADEWKTITLKGEAGFTIAVPSAAADKADAKNPDDLMFVALSTKLNGDLVCIAQRIDYPQGTTREAFSAALAKTKGEAFCQNSRAAAGSLSIGSSQVFERDGRQGAVCTASYTDPAEKNPGRVESTMMLAAASGAYSLTCSVEDEEQGLAEYSWASFWGEKVRHMQESFALPASR
jgi:organic hydroperoxide reductase OsmC/OhrA